ncbi:putative fungal specific transcription [Diaporthe ampelina]|uniref:Putative fungal specific transcription n=1 Tax=Diaporthe ampelina TaxID=1214573 RepID=A0A0G2FK97_9PEZI|nr:putative fungal specific transcription [Diaporthe ampelina]
MRTLQTAYENAQSCGYIHNALAVVSELTILRQSLPAVQALVGMAIILQGTPNPQVSSVLTAAAVRLAQAMGLHRRSHDQSLSARQVEQRKRVFWAAYFLDKDISLRLGQPFAQDDDDMDAELPSESPSDLALIGFGDEFLKINFFNARIGLAVIQGQVYKRLYSVPAARQSEAQKAAVAQELSSVLSYWRSSVPVDFEGDSVLPLQTPLPVEFIHMLILRLTYVNCLVMIDRHLPPLDFTTNHAPDAVTTGASMIAESLCVVESRKAIRLIQVTPPGDYACVW